MIYKNRIIMINLFISALLFFLVLSYGSSLTVCADEPDKEKSDRIIVSLGDSYSSGEGLGDYGDKTSLKEKVKESDWLAHRSNNAWSGRLSLRDSDGQEIKMYENRDSHWYFIASSGAETIHCSKTSEYYKKTKDNKKHLLSEQEKTYNNSVGKDTVYLPSQLDVFKKLDKDNKKADYVTITIGGNDLGFEKIVTSATIGVVFKDDIITAGLLAKSLLKISEKGEVRKKLKKCYIDIQNAAGPQAKIIVAGYPLLYSKNRERYDFGLSRNNYRMINYSVGLFNDVVEELVDECKKDGMNIEFASVEEVFKYYEEEESLICINPISSKNADDLDQKNIISAASMHPNINGANAYVNAVQAKIDQFENVDWKNLYWTYMQDNKLLKLHKTDDRKERWGFWEYPDSIYLKDCDLNGIPEVYIGIFDIEYGTEYIGESWQMLDIINGEVVSKAIFSYGEYYSTASFEGAISDQALKIEGVSVMEIEGVSENCLEKDPDNIEIIKKYIWKDDYLKAETSQRDIMSLSGTYKCTGYSNGLGELQIGVIDRTCIFSFDGGYMSYAILDKSLSGDFVEDCCDSYYYMSLLDGSYIINIEDCRIDLNNLKILSVDGIPTNSWGSVSYEKVIENKSNDTEQSVADKLYDAQPGKAEYVLSDDIPEGWKKAYIDLIIEKRPYALYGYDESDDAPSSYLIYDVDKDGIPELFIRYGNCEAAYHYTIYRYSNGKIEEIATNWCAHTSFHSCSGNGFITFQAHMGNYYIEKVQLNGNELTYNLLDGEYTEEDYPDITNYEENSKYLNEYSFKYILPILDYGISLETKSSLKNEHVRKIISDVAENGKYVYMVICDSFRSERTGGYIKLSVMEQEGFISEYYDVELYDQIWGDLNKDGQDECVLLYKEKDSGSEFYSCYGVVLSFQNDTVYAYIMSYLDKNITVSDGKLQMISDYSKTTRELHFYKNEAYVVDEYDVE